MTEQQQREEIRQRNENRIASFKVGSKIDFKIFDIQDIEMTGTILEIKDKRALVQHKFGTCFAELMYAKHAA